MKNYIVYNDAGKILRTGVCPDTDFLAQAHENELVMEGEADDSLHWIDNGLVTNQPIIETDVATKREDCMKLLRRHRNLMLKRADYTQIPDAPLTDAKKVEWAIYRQALRDLPSQYQDETNIDNVVYPIRPEA